MKFTITESYSLLKLTPSNSLTLMHIHFHYKKRQILTKQTGGDLFSDQAYF